MIEVEEIFQKRLVNIHAKTMIEKAEQTLKDQKQQQHNEIYTEARLEQKAFSVGGIFWTNYSKISWIECANAKASSGRIQKKEL